MSLFFLSLLFFIHLFMFYKHSMSGFFGAILCIWVGNVLIFILFTVAADGGIEINLLFSIM